MEYKEHQKKEGNKYYLKQLNSITNELEWVEIIMTSNSEPLDVAVSKHERIINPISHDYYFETVPTDEEPPMGIEWENLGHFE